MDSHIQAQETSKNLEQEQNLSSKQAQDNTKVGLTYLQKLKKPNEKKVVTYVDENFHARFRIQLRYDDLAQAKFFRICMESYEKRDPEFMAFVYKKLENERSTRKKKMINKDTKELKQIEENFGLDEQEIKNIFDMIATENPDL